MILPKTLKKFKRVKSEFGKDAMSLTQKITALWQKTLQKILPATVKDNLELEEIAERIHLPKTKKYFTEVLSCYQHGNYRSAVVMLWSVVIFDIIEKLQNLVDIYDDKPAKKILDGLIKKENSNILWSEKDLLDDVFNNTNIIEKSDYTNLGHSQKKRHLSAHPSISDMPGNRELYSPNKDTTRALIKEALEGVLTKTPFYTSKIKDRFLNDLNANASYLHDKDSVKKFIGQRYLDRMRSDTQIQMYRSLWKLVFLLDNEDCNRNRTIHFHALEIIGDINKKHIVETIVNEKEYYSQVSPNENIRILLLGYLVKNSNLHGLLEDNVHVTLEGLISKNLTAIVLSRFKKESLMEHFSDVVKYFNDKYSEFSNSHSEEIDKAVKGIVEPHAWDTLAGTIKTDEDKKMFCNVISSYYNSSFDYDTADARFRTGIKPYLNYFDVDGLVFLVEGIEKNSQTSNRNKGRSDHYSIADRIMQLDPSFDVNKHRQFFNRANWTP